MFKKMNKIALCGVLSGLLVLNSVGMVFAVGDLTPDAVISGGSLGLSGFSINSFSGVILSGGLQTTTATVENTTLIDSTGLGAGWQVNLTASRFINSAIGETLNKLPENSLALGTVSIAEVADTGSTPIVISPLSTTISEGVIDNEFGVNIVSTTANNGMGTYTISMLPMTLSLSPKTTYAGTYTSTVTQTITSGPVN